MEANQINPLVIYGLHPNEVISPWALDAFKKGLIKQGVRPTFYKPNWKTPKDQNPQLSRFIEGIDPNRIWLENLLNGEGGLPLNLLLEALKISELAAGRPVITLHRDQIHSLTGKALTELVQRERTGTKTAFPEFHRGGKVLAPPDSLTGLYSYFEYNEDLLRYLYPKLFQKGNYGDKNTRGEFQKGDYNPIVELFYETQKKIKEELPDRYVPTDNTIHRLDPGLGLGRVAVGRSTGIILPQSIIPDGSFESFVIHRIINPSPFSTVVEVPVMPLYETYGLMKVLGIHVGEFLCKVNAMRVDKN